MDYLARIDSLIEEAEQTLEELGRVDLVTALRFRLEKERCITLDKQPV